MSNIPSTMRAVIVDNDAEPKGSANALKLQTMKVPTPGAGEVLIKITASGINRPDVLQRKGTYKVSAGVTEILGLECAGTIVAVGPNCSRYKVGDEVCALLVGGGYAEYAVAPEGQCLPVPAGMDLIHAAILPECVFTVWTNLFESGQLKKGDIALMHGGTSGIGTYAIQMARAIGAEIIVTVSHADKLEPCRKLGASLVIDSSVDDFEDGVEEFTKGNGVDVILDIVGADYLPRNLKCLAPYGRHVSIGAMHGHLGIISIREIMTKHLVITGSTLRPRPVAEKSRIAREVETHIWPLIAAGKIKPQLFQRFPLEKVQDAHKLMESGGFVGKMLLTMS
jgi:putative PIG3 family NAD(P)H quinone oxidoreductase